MELSSPIYTISGIGYKRGEVLTAEAQIVTIEDLLNYFPYRHVDRSKFYHISECTEKMPYIQIIGEIIQFEYVGEGRATRLTAIFTDGTGTMELVWFKGTKYIEKNIKPRTKYIVFGKPGRFGSKINIAHPDIELYSDMNLRRSTGIQSMYNSTDKMKKNYLSSDNIRKYIYSILFNNNILIPETLPEYLIEKMHFTSREQAIKNIHFPKSIEALKIAEARLKFEELFYIQLSMLYQSQHRSRQYRGYIFSTIGDYFNLFYNKYLPFPLTNAQKRVIKEIRNDMRSGIQMNRLLQGDVGSGKTIVALLTALIALDNGYQACLMAPTEILANQHYDTISALVAPLGISVKLLTGSTKKKEKEEILNDLGNAKIQIIIGTHALIEENVNFSNLGYVIIDEQHRFGVAQRAKLWNKNVSPPHVLVMTATPIPRTLAMTVYGDLEVSVIDELPPGRKPVTTKLLFDNRRGQVYDFIHKKIAEGRQIYIVYPLIQENEKIDLRDLEQGYKILTDIFTECKLVMVHGKMKQSEKDEAMRMFVSGEAKIMVATTVIEVGVNVPNASVMVIENAERFGLSQLHQLRGRVGRGADQSYCLLMSKYELTENTRKRLQIMCETNDGFKIAEADMSLRGPGDIDGLQQSGLPFDLKIANLAGDVNILSTARNVAKAILAEDEELTSPKNTLLKKKLQQMNQLKINWGVIS
ncbi:MAG: ATP-dependent DNA helicase RecG [Candidatus Aphodosoma sp.]